MHLSPANRHTHTSHRHCCVLELSCFLSFSHSLAAVVCSSHCCSLTAVSMVLPLLRAGNSVLCVLCVLLSISSQLLSPPLQRAPLRPSAGTTTAVAVLSLPTTAITTSNSLSLNACVCFGISRRFGGGSFLPNERRGSFLSFYSSFSTSFWSFSSPFANGISTYSSSSSSGNDFSQSAKPTLTYFKLCG